MFVVTVALAPACGRPPPLIAPAGTPIVLAEARAQLADAAALCAADHGALWGVSLCGPVMFVDRATRFVVANQADAHGRLRPQDGVFVGTLAADDMIANTATTWAGVRWVQVAWPLAGDRGARAVLLAHEMFHRIAGQVVVPPSAGDCVHLDSPDGRYYLQLEWRALAAALRATADGPRRAAVVDALAFRRARRSLVLGAAATEDALELNEGLAEYTGVVVGHPDAAGRTGAALRDLAAHVDDPSFVRSFAYATGPAYGLLLDRYAPTWRAAIMHTPSLSDALAAAISPEWPEWPDVGRPAARYGGEALRRAEDARGAERAAKLAAYRAALVEGPVLALPFRHMKIEFDPRTVQPLDGLGSIYPTLRVVDAWGTLEVTGGALVTADWTAVVVAAPRMTTATAAPRRLDGAGWTLALAPGWRLVPDVRAGDLRLTDAPP